MPGRFANVGVACICFGILALFANDAFAQIKRSCPVLPRDPKILAISDGILQVAIDSQGKMKYGSSMDDKGGAAEVRRSLRAVDGLIFGYSVRPPEYLLVKQAAPTDMFAIDVAWDADRPFSCFARRGDTVEIRTSFGVAHWTQVYNVDFDHDRIEILDPWPDSFPLLASNSGGLYGGKIQHSGGSSLVVLSTKDFDNTLIAIITIDEPTFADALAAPECGCLKSTSSVKSMLDTLITSGRSSDLDSALPLLGKWPTAPAGQAIRVAYGAATLYIAGARGVLANNEQNADGFVKMFQLGNRDTIFDPLLPAVKVALLGSLKKSDDPVAVSLLASIERDRSAQRFSEVESAIVDVYKAQLVQDSKDIARAKAMSDAVGKLRDLQTSLLTTIRKTPIGRSENGVARDDLRAVVDARISAHKQLVDLFIQSNDAKDAGKNFSQLRDELPTPLGTLVLLGAHACSQFNDANGLKALDAVTPDMPEEKIRLALLSTTCFDTRANTALPCTDSSCWQSISWTSGRWSIFDMVEGDCSTKGVTHLDLTIHPPESNGTLGSFKALHFSADSCFPVVEDRFFCEATYNLRLQERSEKTATFIGTIQEGGNCGEEVKGHTPKTTTILLRRVAENSIDVDSTLYGGWDPGWFSHRIERFERSKP
jgi:hypothetical protein